MSQLNRTTRFSATYILKGPQGLVPPIFYVAKICQLKDRRFPIESFVIIFMKLITNHPDPRKPGVNFINILHTDFGLVDPENVKIQQVISVFLCFWDQQA